MDERKNHDRKRSVARPGNRHQSRPVKKQPEGSHSIPVTHHKPAHPQANTAPEQPIVHHPVKQPRGGDKKRIKKLITKISFVKRILATIIFSVRWRIVIPLTLVAGIIILLSLNLYFANEGRILDQIESNISTVISFEDSSNAAVGALQNAADDNTSLLAEEFKSYADEASAFKLDLPRKGFTKYALDGESEKTGKNIDSLYDAQDELNIVKIQEIATEYVSVAEQLDNISNLDIETQTQELISAQRDFNDSLQNLEQTSDGDFDVMIRVSTQLEQVAIQYQETQDLDRFTSEYNNLYFELPRRLKGAWLEYFSGDIFASLSTLRSSSQGILAEFDR